MPSAKQPAAPENLTDTFLEQYKSLEQILRTTYGADMSVLNYESKMDTSDSDRLRICRIVRNFLQHNSDAKDFIRPTEAMLNHLLKTADHAMLEMETAKDRTYRLTPVKSTMTIRQACKLAAKLGRAWIPVVEPDNTLLGVISPLRLNQLVGTCDDIDNTTIGCIIKKTEWKKSTTEIPIIECSEKLTTYANQKIETIVVRNGKYSGIIQWN